MYKNLLDLLVKIGFPVAYNHFDSPPEIPFISLEEVNSDYIYADDKNYYKHNIFNLNYYFLYKDIDQEEDLEQLLNDNGFVFKVVNETYISNEKIYIKTYEVTL